MTIWAIVPAAGIGSRMAGSASGPVPKQYRMLLGKAVLSHSLGKLLAVPQVAHVVVALNRDDVYWQSLPEANAERISTVVGGSERVHSVMNALLSLERAEDDDWVLVHDAVRPCVAVDDIAALIAGLSSHAVGGLLASPVDNTIKKIDAEDQVVCTVDRESLCNALTPQLFRYAVLREALQHAVADGVQVTDEASALEKYGHRVAVIMGSKFNIKITHEEDLAVAEFLLRKQQEQAGVGESS